MILSRRLGGIFCDLILLVMKKHNKVTGYRGEDLASEYLENKGYLIEERNFRTRFGEIDIVCWDKDILVFVEVKTKIGHDFGEPEEMVSKSKLAQVQRMGEVYTLLKTQDFCQRRTGNKSRTQNNVGNSSQKRHCESRTRAEAIPAILDIVQSGEIASVRNTETRNDGSWSGRCRVDVVGIVLQENGEVERIRHYEAVY